MEGSERDEFNKNPRRPPPIRSVVYSAVRSLKNISLNSNNYCIQCAMTFDDDDSFTSHTQTDEHAIMVLVTGVDYLEEDSQSPNRFAPLFYCVLCNFYSLGKNSHLDHLKSLTHKEMARFMRCICFWKEKIMVGAKSRNKEPFTAQDFEDLKKHPPHYCQLCDKNCNSAKTLECHIKGQMHKKFEQMVLSCEFCNISFLSFKYHQNHMKSDLHKRLKIFMLKMLISQNEIEGSGVSQCIGANNLPLLYFCKLCHIEFNDVESFMNHRELSIHRRIHDLINKLAIKQDDAAMHYEESGKQLVPRVHYCEVCNVWCLRCFQTYDNHETDVTHLIIRRTEVVNKWECSPENRPEGFEPWS